MFCDFFKQFFPLRLIRFALGSGLCLSLTHEPRQLFSLAVDATVYFVMWYIFRHIGYFMITFFAAPFFAATYTPGARLPLRPVTSLPQRS